MDRDELISFARKVRSELDAAGAFADWLEEHGDPRGVLLRRRWKRWRTEREAGRIHDGVVTATRVVVFYIGVITEVTHCRDRADASFRQYIGERFPEISSLTSAKAARVVEAFNCR